LALSAPQKNSHCCGKGSRSKIGGNEKSKILLKGHKNNLQKHEISLEDPYPIEIKQRELLANDKTNKSLPLSND
jgi:hypothetical protein